VGRVRVKAKHWATMCLAAAIPSLLASPLVAQSPDSLGCTLEPGPTRSVIDVRGDGAVLLDDRSEIRLLGLLMPPEPGGHRSASDVQAALAALVSGKSVALAFAGPRSDRWGRVLAHLFVEEAAGTVWVQGALAEGGHARVFAPPGGTSCVEPLLTRESAARAAGRGIWADAANQIRPADRPTELARFADTFQLVHGRVETVAFGREAVLRFASGETAVAGMPPSFKAVVRRQTGTYGRRDLRALVGRDVLVRGWIVARGRGAEIEIVAAGQLQPMPAVRARKSDEPSQTTERPEARPAGALE
jgi:endonuclease YncB( thermonuclease family)